MSSCERIQNLISAYLDDELTQGDHQQVEVHLRVCETCRQTFSDLADLQSTISKSEKPQKLSNHQWEDIMNDIPAKASRGIGWTLLLSGVIALFSFAIWEFTIDHTVEWYVKLAICSVWFGLLFLFLSVMRQRLVAYKKDKYKDIQI